MNQLTIVAVNPGSTSTKMALYRDEEEISRETLYHRGADGPTKDDIWSEFDDRLNLVWEWMRKIRVMPDAVVGIGGLLKPVSSGTYRVNDTMIADARANFQGVHASNLGCAMACDLGKEYKCPSFVVDPVSVDEFAPSARYSGHPLIERKSLSHALNVHAMARRASRDLGKSYDACSFVVAHLGGGITIAPVQGGRIIDANDASSDGPFSPERTGGLPLQQFIRLCFSGTYSENEMRLFVMGKGGLKGYLGTNSMPEVERMIGDGEGRALEVFEAMGYQIAKEIGAMATVLNGHLDGIVLTGGMATSERLVSLVRQRISTLGDVLVYPGENEMLAMVQGVLRVLRNQEPAKTY
jgi:butyrate kinase